MEKPKAPKYKAQRERQRQERREQAERRGIPQAGGLPQTPDVGGRMWSSLRACFRLVWKTVVVVSIVLTCLAFGYPRLSVVPHDEALDPNAPFSVPFIIKNEGNLSFYGLLYRCFLREMQVVGGGGIRNISFVNKDDGRIGDLPGGRQTTVLCDFIVPRTFPILSADVDILVQYRPAFWPWVVKEKPRFVTKEAAGPKLIWFPQSAPAEESNESFALCDFYRCRYYPFVDE
jgi:hypothetical protein